MSGIHPVSAALLLAAGVALAILGGVVLAKLLQQWRHERRKEAALPEDPVIDLTYFHEATRAFLEASRNQDLGPHRERVDAGRQPGDDIGSRRWPGSPD